jgi:hypothetical protein
MLPRMEPPTQALTRRSLVPGVTTLARRPYKARKGRGRGGGGAWGRDREGIGAPTPWTGEKGWRGGGEGGRIHATSSAVG